MDKISIITPTYNSSKTILRTINSISSQTYRNFEHIIIDGISVDETLVLLRNYQGYKIDIYSESDHGIYDAMNKGVKRASGEIIAILNSDDYFYDENVLESVANLFKRGADIVYGGIAYCNNSGDIISKWLPSKFSLGAYANGWHTPHPGFFVKKKLYQTKGYFDLEYKVAADFDLMLRFMEDSSVRSFHLPAIITVMQNDGASSKLQNIIRGFGDIKSSFKKNKIKLNILRYILIRYLPKVLKKLK